LESPGKQAGSPRSSPASSENATVDTWRNFRHEFDRMHVFSLETKEGRIAKRSMTTKGQRETLAALELRDPAQILECELPTPAE
jgi:hypothetical protein